MTAIATTHVRLDEVGVAWIDDTKVKVLEVVQEKLAYGWSPEEIAFQHYGHLSLAQIHAALSYYYDHQAELDAIIEKSLEEYEELRATAGETPVKKKLRALGKIP